MIYSKLEGDHFGQLILGAAVFAYQQPDILHLVIVLEVFNLPVVLDLSVVPLPLAPHAHNLAFMLSTQCLDHLLRVESCTDHFRSK